MKTSKSQFEIEYLSMMFDWIYYVIPYHDM